LQILFILSELPLVVSLATLLFFENERLRENQKIELVTRGLISALVFLIISPRKPQEIIGLISAVSRIEFICKHAPLHTIFVTGPVLVVTTLSGP